MRSGIWFCTVWFYLSVMGCGSRPQADLGVAAKSAIPISKLAVLPLPVQDILPSAQDFILESLARQLYQHFGVRVLTGRALGRAVWGELDSMHQTCSQMLASLMARAKRSLHQLRISKTLELMDQAQVCLSFCGAEIRKSSLLSDVYLTAGLAQLSQAQPDKAEALFRQAVSLDNRLDLPEGKFRADQLAGFQRARRQLLSGNPTQVSMNSWPKGASVWVDGRRVGATPLKAVPLYPGRHFIRMELRGYAPWTLYLPDDVPPTAVRALLVQVFDRKKPPKELMLTVHSRKVLSESVRNQLRELTEYYQVDAILVAWLTKLGKKLQLGTRLYIAEPESIGKIKRFNLGSDQSAFGRKIMRLIPIFRELKRPKSSSRKPAASPAKRKEAVKRGK